MQENEENTGSEKVLILPLNEDSKKITQVLSNDKAMKVMEILAETPMSASDVAEKMGMPLTTIKYNIDALVEADLIKVKQTKWSRKGREIKIYEPVQKIIVVAPGGMKGDKSSILNMLKKYLVMVGGAIFAATGLEVLTNYMSLGAAPMADSMRSAEYQDTVTPLVNEDLPESGSEEAFIPEEALEEKSIPTDEETVAYDTTGEEVQEAESFEGPVAEETVDGQDFEISEAPSSDDMMVTNDIDSDTMSSAVPNESLDDAGDITGSGLDTDMVSQTPAADGSHLATDNGSLLSQPLSDIFPHDMLSHVSVWFLFGCLFVISLLFIREIYYRKKEI